MMKIALPILLGVISARPAGAQLCPIESLDQFDEIARICCESSTGAADCSGGFPAVCTRECSMLMEPWWGSCGPLIGALGDMWAADEDAMGDFATGACHHTNVLFANAAAGGCDAELLGAWTNDVNAACCQQNGVFECDAGTPWSCDAECAIEFVPFWETCMLSSGMSNSADLSSFASLYDTCQALPPAEGRLLMREVNNLINDPWCEINTTGIISIDQANAPCSTDESGFCERTIESGLYTCDEDYCSTCAQAHACDHSCSLPCVGQIGGPALGEAASPPIQICETDSSRMCDRTIAAGLYDCATDYCLTCPQAHMCDSACSLPCGETEDGHRRNLKVNKVNNGTDATNSTVFELHLPSTLTKLNQAAAGSSSRKDRHLQEYWRPSVDTDDTLFDTAPVNQDACPWESFINRAHEVEAQCCHSGLCPNGMPEDCAFDCGRFFTAFLLDCNQTIHNNFDHLTVAEYVSFGDECSRMDPLSMIRAIDGAFCTTCGDNITQAPLEQCDWGAGNSYEPNSCRPDCMLPRCGDGVIDTVYPAAGPAIAEPIPTTVLHFTTLGTEGNHGPTSTAGYTGTELEGQIELDQYGRQIWTVPASGVYAIEAYGADGKSGYPTNGESNTGGQGASISGEFELQQGETLTILVGQLGTMGNPSQYCGSMGGGGTFIVHGDDALLVAGGGGGAGRHDGHPGGDASTGESGQGNSDGSSQGGSSGNGGTEASANGGCSGAGFSGAGHTSNYCETAPLAFINGGIGGIYGGGTGTGGFGGFGGGGAGHTTCEVGGGGGYSGGGAGCSHGCGGGGGGSYNAGANQQSGHERNPPGTSAGEQSGSVIIRHAGPPVAELCDDGMANSDDAPCRNDCTRSCPRLDPVAEMTITMTAGLAPGSVATYRCATGPIGQPLTCRPDGTWTGVAPTTCAINSCSDYVGPSDLVMTNGGYEVYCDTENDGGGWTLVATVGGPGTLAHLTTDGEMSDGWSPGEHTNRLHSHYTEITGTEVRVGRMVGTGTNVGNILQINDCTAGDAACLWSQRITQNDGDMYGNWVTNGATFRHDPGGCTSDGCPARSGTDRDYSPEHRIAIFGGDCYSSCASDSGGGFSYTTWGPSHAYWSQGTVTPGATAINTEGPTSRSCNHQASDCPAASFRDVWIR